MKRLLSLLAIVAVGLAIVGCGIGERSTGKLVVNLENRYARTMLPPESMTVAEYIISGDGPGSVIFGPETVTGTTTIDGLIPGPWTVSVIGQNANHVAIGAGSGSTSVVIGQTAQLSITVQEYMSPDGSLQLDLAYEPAIVDYPSFVGSLTDSAAVETVQSFAIDLPTCTATNTTTALHPGYYAEVVRLYNAPNGLDGSEVLSTGFAECVRVAAGQQTAGSIFLHAVQGWGQLELHFDLQMNDPLILSGSPAFGSVGLYDNETGHFTISADVAAVYQWYLRGQLVGTGASFDLGANGLIGGEYYRLDVIAFSVDGKRGGSANWNVTRLGANPAFHTVRGVIAGGELTGNGGAAIFLPDHTMVVFADLVGAGGPLSFTIPNCPDGEYWLAVWADSDNDNLYDPGSEEVEWWSVSGGESGTQWPPFGANLLIPNDGAIVYQFDDLR